MTRILLVGNPNCGKTTLFNALTGDTQRVGNWPGVTVEKKTGTFIVQGQTIDVTDLPGTYSLVDAMESSQDAHITAQEIAYSDADVLINVIDACHLERHLYLTSQLLELGKPVILVINMTDMAKERGISIDDNALSLALQCPVVMVQANRQQGLDKLMKAIQECSSEVRVFHWEWPASVKKALTYLEHHLQMNHHSPSLVPYFARRIIEGDTVLVRDSASLMASFSGLDLDILMADARYQAIHDVVVSVQKKRSDAREQMTARIDRIVLHRFWAFPIFLSLMYVMFLLAINLGGAFQDFFSITTDTIFVQGSARLLQHIHAPSWLIALCANGIGKGINTTLTFIPVIASMYFFLSLLEGSGYMARAAFVVDKLMRLLGLPGKSFVPMIVGFGCNVPGIMAARTLDSEKDRLLTVLMSPFMSCSARLAIYAVFVSAFFPSGGQNVVFSLYLIGILMAVLTGLLLRKTLLRGNASPLILELPAYQPPSWKRIGKDTGLRVYYFIKRAGMSILPVCVILGVLNALTLQGGLTMSGVSHASILSWLGQKVTPLFSPMGLTQDNWPATVGLLTGVLAKEVVIGSMNTLYADMGGVIQTIPMQFDFWGSLQEAFVSIPRNLAHLGAIALNPIPSSTVIASAVMGESPQSIYGIMYQHFDGKAGAYAYLLFILLYIPCISTMAAIRQEANRKLMWFSIVWSVFVAYATAVSFYQLATIMQHPQQTCVCLLCVLGCVIASVAILRCQTDSQGTPYVAANT